MTIFNAVAVDARYHRAPPPIQVRPMKIAVNDEQRTQARAPHDLYILNMILFNLGGVACLLAYTIGQDPRLIWATVGALAMSLGIFGYIRFRAARIAARGEWFVAVHWHQASSRARLVLIGYVVTAAIIGIGLLVGNGSSDHNMRLIMLTVFTRIGVVPSLLLILVTAILEGQSTHLVNHGIAPGKLVRRFPPPAGVVVLDAMTEDAG